MVVLRSKLHTKPLSRSGKTAATKHPRMKKQSPKKTVTPSRRTLSDELKRAEMNRIPSPLTEIKDVDRHMSQDLARDAKLKTRNVVETDRHCDQHRYRRRLQKKGKENTPRDTLSKKTTRGCWDVRKKISPPVKREKLEDEFPMIIECWQ